jgi:hypothetical protein
MRKLGLFGQKNLQIDFEWTTSILTDFADDKMIKLCGFAWKE